MTALVPAGLTVERGVLGADSSIGVLALPVRLLPAGTTVGEVDLLFRSDAGLNSLAVPVVDGPGLITRTRFQQLLIGPLGYGRAVYSRSALHELVDTEALLLAADTSLGAAAQQLLDRPVERRYDDALVAGPGTLGLLAVSVVFEQLARHFAHQSVHDPLTGLPNRLLLADRVRRLPPPGPGGRTSPALLYVDLDGFKAVNDDHGHDVGDAVLVQYAERLRGAVRPGDVVARLGGDEFALLLVDPVTDAQASAVADRVVLLASAPFLVAESVVHLGASVGIARADDSPEQRVDEVEALLRAADQAMYRAKTSGRGRVARDRPAAAVGGGRRVVGRELDRRLRVALDRGALTLAYQPKFELATGRLLEHEALARWDDETGSVSPALFIPAAEGSGLIHRLGRWALQAACEQARGWGATGPGGVDRGPLVAVNVSPHQLADPGFVAGVAEVLAQTGLPGHRLSLEITESAAIDDLVATRAKLLELRALGVQLALDDFGTGHASLTLLRALPLDWVKVDRSFVEDVADDAAGAVLVRLVIETAHSLGARVCAEGVERPEQLVALLAMGCDAVQGYLLGVPARTPALRPVRPMVELAEPAPPPTGPRQLVAVCDSSGRLSYVSAESVHLLGCQPADLVGTLVTELLVDPSGAPDTTAVGLLDRLRTSGLLLVAHRDGSLVWLEVEVRPLGGADGATPALLVTATDATARVLAEQALADREDRLGAAFDEAPIGMALTAPDGRHLKVNASLCRMLQRSEDELLAVGWQDVTHPDDRAEDQRRLAGALAGDVDGYRISKRFVLPGGGEVSCLLQVRVLRSAGGTPRYVVAHVLPAAA